MTLVFATNNQHKLFELRRLAENSFKILGLSEAGFEGEIPEDYASLEQNASQKSWYIYNRIHQNCFADDTGLEVEALNGAPGVYSARFSKIGNLQYHKMEVSEGNIRKLLELMRGESNRNARFRTVISLIFDGIEYQFEGIISGTIASEKSGSTGFGYDPVFIPDGELCSFAEMDLEKKNSISHRGRAVEKLIRFLKSEQP